MSQPSTPLHIYPGWAPAAVERHATVVAGRQRAPLVEVVRAEAPGDRDDPSRRRVPLALGSLVEVMRGHGIVHVHRSEPQWLLLLAANLAGATTIVQTLLGPDDREDFGLADWSLVSAEPQRRSLSRPTASQSCPPNGSPPHGQGASPPRSFGPDDLPGADALGRLSSLLNDAERGDVAGALRAGQALADGPRGILHWWLAARLLVREPYRIELLQIARACLGDRLAVLLALGQAAAHRGEDELAMEALERARGIDATLVPAAIGVAQLHRRRGAPGAARDVLQRIANAPPGHEHAERLAEQLEAAPSPISPPSGPLSRLVGFRRIIVTGPHRSGTTIATEMIARELGFESMLEESFEFYRADLLHGLLRRRSIVVQCPALFDLMPQLSDEHTAIVLMRRPLHELDASRKRMYARRTGRQLSAQHQNVAQLRRLEADAGDDAARVKYERWDDWIARDLIHNPVEIEYADLADHPLWVSATDRRRLGPAWHTRRTRV